jgi:ABC-2 type transport system permease protein
LRRNLAAGRLAILSQLEYRTNFLIDAVIQPVISTSIEVTLWMAIISSMGGNSLGGFGREYYLGYALWANYFARITTNWMYSYTMMEDIDTGRVNTLLTRPMSFYEFFLFQFVSYKLFVTAISFTMPVAACLIFGGSMHLDRLPLVLVLLVYYLVFIHTMSFCIACLAFYLNRSYSFIFVTNMALWVLAGEMIPLDLYPEPLRTWLIHSPVASGVYIPVGYLTGRFGIELVWQSFGSITVGILVLGVVGRQMWRGGLLRYTGTGA